MITIYDSADMQRVLSGPFDPDLKMLLVKRLDHLDCVEARLEPEVGMS